MAEEETKRRTYPRRGDLVTVRPSFFRLYTKMAAKEGSYRKETLDSVYNKLVCRKSEIDHWEVRAKDSLPRLTGFSHKAAGFGRSVT